LLDLPRLAARWASAGVVWAAAQRSVEVTRVSALARLCGACPALALVFARTASHGIAPIARRGLLATATRRMPCFRALTTPEVSL